MHELAYTITFHAILNNLQMSAGYNCLFRNIGWYLVGIRLYHMSIFTLKQFFFRWENQTVCIVQHRSKHTQNHTLLMGYAVMNSKHLWLPCYISMSTSDFKTAVHPKHNWFVFSMFAVATSYEPQKRLQLIPNFT